MPTQTRSTAKRAVVNTKAAPPTHHGTDVSGIVLIALGGIMLVALIVGRGGLIGDSLRSVFSNLFGRVAWLVPFVLFGLGLAHILGSRKLASTRLAWGIGIVFLSIVGLMAHELNGDYFDPDTVAISGGYAGAVVGWLFDTLLGAAKLVGLGALGMIGAILCLDTPIKSLIELASKRNEVPTRAAVTVPKSNLVNREARDRASSVAQGESDRDDARPVAQPPKTSPVIRQNKQMPIVSLQTQSKEGYELPPLTLLQEPVSRQKRTPEEMQRNIVTLERTLEEFGIDANVVEIATGPTLTRYEIQLGPGIRVNRVTALGDNIAMNLAASQVRVEAPIPGKAAIGVEVPNERPTMVTLREVCETKEFQDHPSRLAVGLGQDVSGANRYADLTKMPHLLIGGATNSGKSIGLASIITSLIMRNTPKDVRLVMIDPKRVELSLFDGIPHLMCPVVKDTKEAPGVLRAVWREMDIRYDRLSERGVRNIDGWNAKASFAEQLPYIVVVIDELADLMIQAAAEVETSIVRLAQLARAVGIHLVIATQRPSVDVITGTIKANIPSRIAFGVSSHIDSRTILDGAGAEKLMGRGDMLFLPIDANKPVRIQGCYVSEKEIEEICAHWKRQEQPQYVLTPVDSPAGERAGAPEGAIESDELWEDVVRFVVERGQASTSMLQRRFSIGFQRASRLIDMMEERGIVGPRDGPRPRDVLVDPMDVESLFGRYPVQEIEMDPLDD